MLEKIYKITILTMKSLILISIQILKPAYQDPKQAFPVFGASKLAYLYLMYFGDKIQITLPFLL
jgi:hypothetical protein